MDKANDRASQWLFPHFPEAVLLLAGVEQVLSCEAIKEELVAPRRTPDALIRATLANRPEPVDFLIEMELDSSPDNDRQMFEDLILFALDRRRMPEGILVVLRPKGHPNPGRYQMQSPWGNTLIQGQWQTISVWNLQAEDYLAHNEVGVIPLVPFMRRRMSDQELLERCFDLIQKLSDPERIESLQVTTMVFAESAKRNAQVLASWKDKIMWSKLLRNLESPTLDRFRKEAFDEGRNEGKQEGIEVGIEKGITDGKVGSIGRVLQRRFGPLPEGLNQQLAQQRPEQLDQLLDFALDCTDLASFLSKLA